jgi:hypothetical protein
MKKALLIMSIIFLLGRVAYAQTPNFISQDIAISETGTTVPFYYSTAGIRSQILYSPATFSSITSTKTITKLYFVSTAANGPWVFTNLIISLGQPNVTQLTNSAYVPNLTPVLTAVNYSYDRVVGAWTSFTLDVPFAFDPTLPLVLEINAQHQAPGTPSWNVRSHNPTIAGSYRNYSTSYNTAAPSSASQTFIPIIGFDFGVAIQPTTVPPLATFANSATDTIWMGSPKTIVNTSNGADAQLLGHHRL